MVTGGPGRGEYLRRGKTVLSRHFLTVSFCPPSHTPADTGLTFPLGSSLSAPRRSAWKIISALKTQPGPPAGLADKLVIVSRQQTLQTEKCCLVCSRTGRFDDKHVYHKVLTMKWINRKLFNSPSQWTLSDVYQVEYQDQFPFCLSACSPTLALIDNTNLG